MMIVNGFDCRRNKLTQLSEVPRIVRGNFDCSYNLLTRLAGAPQRVIGDFSCRHNLLGSLIFNHGQELLEIDGELDVSFNPITKGGAGLIVIEGLRYVHAQGTGDFEKAVELINRHLRSLAPGDNRKLAAFRCQEELIYAELDDFGDFG